MFEGSKYGFQVDLYLIILLLYDNYFVLMIDSSDSQAIYSQSAYGKYSSWGLPDSDDKTCSALSLSVCLTVLLFVIFQPFSWAGLPATLSPLFSNPQFFLPLSACIPFPLFDFSGCASLFPRFLLVLLRQALLALSNSSSRSSSSTPFPSDIFFAKKECRCVTALA